MLLRSKRMEFVGQSGVSCMFKVMTFVEKLDFSCQKVSCLPPACLLIFSRLEVFKCRFRGNNW